MLPGKAISTCQFCSRTLVMVLEEGSLDYQHQVIWELQILRPHSGSSGVGPSVLYQVLHVTLMGVKVCGPLAWNKVHRAHLTMLQSGHSSHRTSENHLYIRVISLLWNHLPVKGHHSFLFRENAPSYWAVSSWETVLTQVTAQCALSRGAWCLCCIFKSDICLVSFRIN